MNIFDKKTEYLYKALKNQFIGCYNANSRRNEECHTLFLSWVNFQSIDVQT